MAGDRARRLTVLGRFLELSVQAQDIRASLEFYEALGFEQCVAGETWRHPYAVLSDGRCFVGLHEYEFDSPALTFVRPGLSAHLPELERRGVSFEFRKTGEDTFNEAGFLDPDGHMIALLEARTYSPPSFHGRDFSALGRFRAYVLPVRNAERALEFWRRLDAEGSEGNGARIEAGGAGFELHEVRGMREVALVFGPDDPEALGNLLNGKGIDIGESALGPALTAPEGLRIVLADSGRV